MNSRIITTVFYYCSAVAIVYVIVLTFFDTAQKMNPVPVGFGDPVPTAMQNETLETTTEVEKVTQVSQPPCSLMSKIVLRQFVTGDLYKIFYMCSYPMWSRFQGLPDQMLANWAYSVYVCDQEDMIVDVPLMPYPTKNKTYWGIPPQCQERHNLVTLGIRDDFLAIQMMKETWGDLKTFGTSAIDRRNDHYDEFYNYAIGVNGTGMETHYDDKGSVSELRERTVKSFFKDVLRIKVIDMLWVNLEGGEFEYWKFLGKEGILDKIGVTVCQINLEINKDDGVHFEKFMVDVYSSRWFMFMRPTISQKERITRAFFLNIEDRTCVRKYLK